MNTISLTIDGKQTSCSPGTSILDAATELGIKIPTLCHHPALTPHGACRLCLVEDTNSGRLFASCVTPIAQDSIIVTDNERLRTHRRNIIRLLMAEHTESCLVCSKGNQCRLRELGANLGVGETDLYPMKEFKALEEANPFIVRDLNKCILCGKCIRADHELVNVGAIDYSLRGFNARPATVGHLPLEQSTCTFCGTCVAICPTGALSAKNTHFIGTPEREATTVCGFCGVGCSLRFGTAADTVIETNPNDADVTVNGPTLCVRGHFAHDFLNSAERLTTPTVKEAGEVRSCDWEEAFEVAAKRLLGIRKQYGPQSIGFIGSTKCTNEENYLFQKIARNLLNTNNIDNASCLSGRSTLDEIGNLFLNNARPLADLEKAEAIMVIGADPTHSTPVLGYYLKRAARNGVPLIVIDPRRTGLTTFASSWLPVTPGADLALVNALAVLIVRESNYEPSFIKTYTDGFNEFKEALYDNDLDNLLHLSGVDQKEILSAAELLQKRKIAFVLGHGVTLQSQGRAVMEALVNLALMTGSIGKARGFYPLAHENNEVGAIDMGAVPNAFPGRSRLDDDEARKGWETAWQCTLSPDPGLDMIRMLKAAEAGTLKGLYIMGENPLRTVPQGERVREALDKLDFLLVQDILATETTSLAHLVLPGAAFSEKEGSFTNMEGCVQTFTPVVSPPGGARSDWEILDELGGKLGAPRRFGSIGNVRSEIGRNLSSYGSYEIVESRMWVEAEPLETIAPKLRFYPVRTLPESEKDPIYDKTAIIGSLRVHLGSGTRTSRSERIHNFNGPGYAFISPADARDSGLESGAHIRIISPQGWIEREVSVTRDLKTGQVFVPKGFNGNDARNLLEFSSREGYAAPAWNVCPVRIEMA